MKPIRSYVLPLTSEVLLIVYVMIAERALGEPHASSIIVVVLPEPAEARIMRLLDSILDIFRDPDLFCALKNPKRAPSLIVFVFHVGKQFLIR
jgi:hypothetical protein